MARNEAADAGLSGPYRGRHFKTTTVVSAPASRGVLDNFVTLAGAGAFTKALTFVTMLVVARELGPLKLGELALAQVLITYGTIFSDAGLTDLTLRDIVRHPAGLVRSVNVTTAVQLVVALTLTAALIAVGLAVPLPVGSARLVLAYSPALVACALGSAYALQAMEQMRAVASMRCLMAVTVTGGTIALVTLTHDPLPVCLMAWIGLLAGDVFTAWQLKKRFGWHPHLVRVAECTTMARRGLPFLGNTLLYSFLWVVDTIAIVTFRSPHDLGIYTAAWQLCITAVLTVTILTDAVYPEMVRRWKAGGDSLAQFVSRLVSITSRIAMAGAALGVMEARPIVRALLGGRYSTSADILRIEIWLVPLGFFAALLSYALVAAGAQNSLLRLRVTIALLAVVGCTLGAAVSGIVAVAWAMLGTTVVECVLLARLAQRGGIGSPVVALVRQCGYVVLPVAALAVVNLFSSGPRLALAIIAWLGTLMLVEGASGFTTLRQLIRMRQGGTKPQGTATDGARNPVGP